MLGQDKATKGDATSAAELILSSLSVPDDEALRTEGPRLPQAVFLILDFSAIMLTFQRQKSKVDFHLQPTTGEASVQRVAKC